MPLPEHVKELIIRHNGRVDVYGHRLRVPACAPRHGAIRGVVQVTARVAVCACMCVCVEKEEAEEEEEKRRRRRKEC